MRTKLVDRFWLGLGVLFFGAITYSMCLCSYNIITGLITHWSTDSWFIQSLGIVVTIFAILFIPLTVILTVMFFGWFIGKDWFRIDGDKYDQVEMNFKEK